MMDTLFPDQIFIEIFRNVMLEDNNIYIFVVGSMTMMREESDDDVVADVVVADDDDVGGFCRGCSGSVDVVKVAVCGS